MSAARPWQLGPATGGTPVPPGQAGTEARPTGPRGVALTALVEAGAFGGPTRRARLEKARRWAARLSAGQRWGGGERGSPVFVSAEARLPADKGGVAAGVWLAGCREPDRLAGKRLPAGAAECWSERDFRRFLDSHELLESFDAIRAKSKSDDEALVRLKAERGEWLAAHGWPSPSLSTVRMIRKRVTPGSEHFDGNVDRRGRKRGVGTKCSDEAWAMFLDLVMDQSRLALRQAWEFVAPRARENGWTWPSYGTVLTRFKREIPRPAVVRARQGERAYKAKCEPKLHLDLTDLPAMHTGCCDQRTLDFFARVPDGKGGWKRVRLVLTAMVDVRSRLFVGWWLDVSGNSDTILAALRVAAEAHGLFRRIIQDNGKDYLAVSGKPRRGRAAEVERERIGGVYAELGIEVVWATPYQPWAMIIESQFRWIKRECDKLQRSYCGGSPAEKPERAAKAAANVMELPTLEEARGMMATAIATIHATPHSGSGIGGLTPTLAMEQFREEKRTCDPALLGFLCTKPAGVRTVTRDGVSYNGIRYGNHDPELHKLQGQQFVIRPDPLKADQLTLCELAPPHKPVMMIFAEKLSGATHADLRRVMHRKAACRKAIAGYRRHSDFLWKTPTQQILEQRRRDAESREAELRRKLGDPKPADVPASLVRPDLVEPVQRVKRRAERKRRAGAFGAQTPLGSQAERQALELLATPACDDSPAELSATDKQRLGLAMLSAKRDGRAKRRLEDMKNRLAARYGRAAVAAVIGWELVADAPRTLQEYWLKRLGEDPIEDDFDDVREPSEGRAADPLDELGAVG